MEKTVAKTPAQPVSQSTPAVVAEPAQASVTPVSTVQSTRPSSLPEDTSTRTKEEFDKLLDNNRKLFEVNQLLQEEINRRVMSNQQFAPVQQAQGVSQQPAVNPQDFVEIDPMTGQKYINEERLRQTLTETNTRAQRAEQVIQNYIQTSEQREIDRQNKEAFSVYPELNPRDQNFDQKFSSQTEALILHSMVNPKNYGGRPLSFVEAARFIKGETKPNVVPEVSETKPNSTQEQKEQASVSLQSQPPEAIQSVNSEELQQLRARTRYGDDAALAERLKYAPHIVPKES